MARITVQDCLENVGNRFELVLAAARRARHISLGAEPRVPRENDKPTVLALREIADGVVGREVLDEPDVESEPEAEAGVQATAESESDAGTAADETRSEESGDDDEVRTEL